MRHEVTAKELIEKYKQHEFFGTPLVKDGVIQFLPESIAKQCAIIAVEEIISTYKWADGSPGSTYKNPGKFFWMQVLTELKKITYEKDK